MSVRVALSLAVLAALTACGPAKPKINRIEATVSGPGAIDAQLYLCDASAVTVPGSGGHYELRAPSDCEGSGRLMIRYIDGSSVACPIRYVTPTMDAWYRFEVAGGRCRIK